MQTSTRLRDVGAQEPGRRTESRSMERSGTLPVSASPVYVFLALDHNSTFISSSAVASLALNSATAIYLTVYVLIAQRRSMWLSISLAL